VSKRIRIGAVAKQIGVSESSLRRWEEQGRIPRAERNISGQRFYRAADVPKIEAAIFPTRDSHSDNDAALGQEGTTATKTADLIRTTLANSNAAFAETQDDEKALADR
jgi:DNA-binding transcriptional MerR regulator